MSGWNDGGMYECMHVFVHVCVHNNRVSIIGVCVGVLHARVCLRLFCLNPAKVPAERVPEWASAGEAQHRRVTSWLEGVRRINIVCQTYVFWVI